MKLTTIGKAIAGLALATGVAGAANAFTITVGSYKMIVDSYDSGTIYDTSVAGTICTTTATCDAAIVFGAAAANGSEDTWGILSVSSITNLSTNTTEFSRGADGYLIGMFYGLTDYKVVSDGVGGQTAFSHGGSIELYTSATNYHPEVGPSSGRAAVVAANTGPAANLYLSADFAVGASAIETSATYVNHFDTTTGSGSGSGFLSYTGGSGLSHFDTNTRMTFDGFTLADARFTATVDPVVDTGDLGFGAGWLAGNSADVRGFAVPEPGSMALVGLGLMGLAGLSRRKQKS